MEISPIALGEETTVIGCAAFPEPLFEQENVVTEQAVVQRRQKGRDRNRGNGERTYGVRSSCGLRSW
jgi:hypothetical protein